jgi:hypothetical protein
MIKYFIFAFSFTLILGCKNNGKETIRNYDKIEDKVYFNITDVKQFELDELSKLKLPFPKNVRRFYLTENGETKNFYSECIYENNDGLIANTYTNLKVSFQGDSNNLLIRYNSSAGRMASQEGASFTSGLGNSFNLNESYGTGASIIELSKNEKVIFNKFSDF